ncbi:proteasome component M29 [Coemansia brasiliensis]|uniref:Proteasome component M29 n=1 Tax=Coemansia brasiliensis TaxID=2650707 RepID=A0A9W8I9Z7_9FUNG|nr:proteasome component M29 [Coemansia brasiliensis]
MTDSADIELVENLRLRFALAQTDEQLQKLLTGLLVPLLDKLDIASAAVRSKIIALLGQINKKLKGRPDVTLPVEPLLESTFTKEASGFSQGFRLMYLSMAMHNSSESQLVTAIPLLLDGIHLRPNSQQPLLIASLLTAMLNVPELTEKQMQEFGFMKNSHRATALAHVARDLFLFNAVHPKEEGVQGPVSAGLSLERQSALNNNSKAPWTSDKTTLEKIKQRMVQIVGSGAAFPTEMPELIHEQRALALVCASCDPYFQQISDRGKDALNRMRPIDYESETLVSSIFAMFLGGRYADDAAGVRSPVNANIKLKLFSYLNKSIKATASFQQWIRVVSESLFGNGVTAKLRQQGMSFMLWAIDNAPLNQIDQASPLLLQLIQRTLAERTSTGNSAPLNEDQLRGSAYLAYGMLAKRVPSLALDNLNHLQALFDAFAGETANVRSSIQEGLLAMLSAYKDVQLSQHLQTLLPVLLQNQLQSPVYQARYCALRYAISVFPLADMEARWLCILGLADSKHEIQQLARSGLEIKPSVVLERNCRLPTLNDAVMFVHNKAQHIIAGSQTLVPETRADANITNPLVFCSALDFCRSLLLATGIRQQSDSLVIEMADLEFINKKEALSSELQRQSMRSALSSLDAQVNSSVSLSNLWLELVGTVLRDIRIDDATIVSKALMYLVEVLALGPQTLSLMFFNNKQLLLSRLDTHNYKVQLYAAQALSVVHYANLLVEVDMLDLDFWNEKLVQQLRELLSIATAPMMPKALDKQQGAIIALGYISHGLTAALLTKKSSDLGLAKLEQVMSDIHAALLQGLQAASDPAIHPTIASVWCTAASEVYRLDPSTTTQMDTAEQAMAAAVKLATSASTPKVYEEALSLMSDIAVGRADMAASMIEFLCSTAGSTSSKQLDKHFKSGEALARALGRFECTLVRADWVLPNEPAQVIGKQAVNANQAAVDQLFTKLTTEMAKSTKVQERQAAAIWTLTVVQSCPGLEALNPWLSKLHASLSMLLSDRSELTQEVASRALGLIYNMGDTSLKEDMVFSLISLFGGNTGNNRRAAADGGNADVQQALRRQIQSDEPLLEQESLGQTPDGHAVNTTYKSILSLASDMQNPSLVYQFMQLATHTAMWNSRCGAAYGMANIIEQARGAIQPYMKSMVPKLYRYTFDPSPQTQAAMKSIWSALLGPSSQRAALAEEESSTEEKPTSGAGVIERYWDAIIEECLESMGQREWKVRESGCNALASAVSGADPELVVPYLGRIWQMSFRALDDIKGSVREAGLKMCQSMASATVAWCTPSTTESKSHDRQAQAIIASVVPFLVDKGVGSDAEDVRNFSMSLLLKLCRTSGRYLSSFAPVIIERLIESLSDMEPQTANYLTFHAEGHGISQEQLESVRLSAVKSSPIMQGVEMVLEYLTPKSMGDLVPKLQNIIRHGLGLPARAGCARTVVVLCVKKVELVRPFASALVKAISGSLTESSALQRQAWATAIGYMAPMLSPKMFGNLLKHLEKIYFDKYSDEVRGVLGQVLEQLAQRCPERLREASSGPGAVSFVHFGCWDANKVIAVAFENVWHEFIIGLGKLATDGLPEMLRLPLAHIADDSWPCRIQSAKAISDIANMVEREARSGNSSSQACSASVRTLADATLRELVSALHGRLWPGKEHVLGALIKVYVVCADTVAANKELSPVKDAVCSILLKELKHGEVAYRREVVKHYCALAKGTNLDLFDQMSGALLQQIEQYGAAVSNSNAMDIDDDEHALKRPQQLMLVAAAIEAMQLTLPSGRHLGDDEARLLATILQRIALTGVWNIRVASLGCLAALIGHCVRKTEQSHAEFTVDIAPILEAVKACATDGKYVSVRTAALDTLEAVFRAISKYSADSRASFWREEAKLVLDLFLIDPVPSISDRAKEIFGTV